MEQQNLSELAKQGNAQAIATFMNRSLQPKGITVKAVMKNDCLQIMLEAVQVPNQQVLVPLINKWMSNLGAESIKKVKVFGRKTGEEFPAWNEEFEVAAQKVPNFEELAQQGDVNALTKLINQWLNSQGITAKAILKNDCLQVKVESNQVPDQVSVVSVIREGLIGLDIQFCQKVKIFGQQTGDDFPDWQEEFELNQEVDSTVITPEIVVEDQSSAAIVNVEPASQLTVKKQPSSWGGWLGAVKGAAVSASKGVASATVGTAGAVGSAVVSASKGVAGTAGVVGGAAVSASKGVAGAAVGTAGVVGSAAVSASKAVAETAVGVGGAIGNAAMQAPESVGYVLDLVTNNPQLQQFTKALPQVDWLLKLLDQVDIVKAETQVRRLQEKYPHEQPNAIIGASTNAALLYALGYAACRFYEAKLTPTITMEATLETAQLESQKFLKSAISQEVIMDQILIHVYLAGNPEKTWEEILPELKTLNLSPASLEAIAANSNSPPSLESLLAQINNDFAVPLLAQCEKVAQLDGVITPEESQVIETITRKFNINLEAITL